MAIFKTGQDDASRLRVIQDFTDQFTREGIQNLDLRSPTAILEVGPGAGSITRWLAAAHPGASIDAVDIDTSLLAEEQIGNLNVVQADIAAVDYLPGSFDLIHARFVLSHLVGRDELVARFASWLRPGGFVVITDALQLPPAQSPHPIVARVFGAYVEFVESRGMDLHWVRQVPSLLARSGLTQVSHLSRTTFLGGADQDRWAPLIAPVAEPLMAAGITADELAEFFEALEDRHVLDIPQIILTVTGRKP